MTPQEALQVLGQVAAKFVGTLADHQAIQRALEVLKVDAAPKPEPAGESEPAE